MGTNPTLRGTRKHRIAVAVFVGLTLLLAGWLLILPSYLAEGSLDMTVYFDNNTDQILYLRRRDQLDQLNKHAARIEPSATTPAMLIPRNTCYDGWVLTGKDGTLVKDPGKVCWHETVTIP